MDRRVFPLLLLVAGPVLAAEQTAAQQEYYRAVGQDRKGESREALERLDRVAAEHPEDRFADDALFRGAEICERKLLDLEGALARYRTLTERYPRSRLFRRAEKRLAYLGANRGSGDRVLLEFEKLIRETPLSDLERTRQTRGRLEALLAEHPDFPQAARATYWIAEAHFKLGQEAEAFATLARVAERFAGTDWALRARLRAGDAHVARRRFTEAAEEYRAAGPKAASSQQRAEEWILRQRLAGAGLVGFLILLVALLLRIPAWRLRGRDLWPLPAEVIFLLPGLAFLVVLGRAHSAVFWKPVAVLTGGGLLLVWIGALSLRRRPVGSRWGAVAGAGLTLVVGLGYAYATIYHYNLLESVVHTWQFGAE